MAGDPVVGVQAPRSRWVRTRGRVKGGGRGYRRRMATADMPVAVPTPGDPTDQADPTDPAELMDGLRALATRVINEHLDAHGLCAVCSSAFPCERAVLAEHNLEATA